MFSRKLRNFGRMFGKMKPKGVYEYYLLKYVRKHDFNNREIKLKNGLNLSVNQKEGDLCTLYEIFIDEDYKFTNSYPEKIKILDIGANIGYFSLYASMNYPKGSIYSFEPFPPTYKRLRDNISNNNIHNIKSFPFAVADKIGKVNFYSIDWAGCNTLVPGKFDEGLYQLTEVDCIKFSDVFKLSGEDSFDFAKIDCEGSEYPIFLNSEPSDIKRVKEYVIEVHLDKVYKTVDLIDRFKELGYNTELNNNILRAKLN